MSISDDRPLIGVRPKLTKLQVSQLGGVGNDLPPFAAISQSREWLLGLGPIGRRWPTTNTKRPRRLDYLAGRYRVCRLHEEHGMIELNRTDDVFVLRMDGGENRMNRAWVDSVNEALDVVDAAGDPRALVTTGAGKFYSNGLDLEWLGTGVEDLGSFAAEVERIFARILGAPYPTVAACNGHTFAAGAMLAMAHDFRVMRADRGFFCLPEVDLQIPLTPGMNALMMSRLPTVTAHEVLVTGQALRRRGGSCQGNRDGGRRRRRGGAAGHRRSQPSWRPSPMRPWASSSSACTKTPSGYC